MGLVFVPGSVNGVVERDSPTLTLTLKLGSGAGLILFSVAGSFLAELSKDDNGEYPYDPLTIPPVVELCKFILSVVLFVSSGHRRSTVSLKSYLLFAVPALCYFVSNSCMFFVVKDVGVAQFQLLSTIKVFFTAGFMRIFLGQRLSVRRTSSLLILALGLVLTQMHGRFIIDFNMRFRGYILAVAACLASSIGGVYSEKLLKNLGDSVHLQNIQLYSWGLAFGIFVYWSGKSGIAVQSPFAGYNGTVHAMILMLSLNGLSVSILLKYADALVKSMVSSLALSATVCLQVLRGAQDVSFIFTVGVLLIAFALKAYTDKS